MVSTIILHYNVTLSVSSLWDLCRICGPSLTKTSLCAANRAALLKCEFTFSSFFYDTGDGSSPTYDRHLISARTGIFLLATWCSNSFLVYSYRGVISCETKHKLLMKLHTPHPPSPPPPFPRFQVTIVVCFGLPSDVLRTSNLQTTLRTACD